MIRNFISGLVGASVGIIVLHFSITFPSAQAFFDEQCGQRRANIDSCITDAAKDWPAQKHMTVAWK